MAEVKFVEEDLAKIKSLQDDFNSVVLRLGQLKIEQITIGLATKRVEEAIEQAVKDCELLVDRERVLGSELSSKYGAGTLDPKTGMFTPNATNQQTV